MVYECEYRAAVSVDRDPVEGLLFVVFALMMALQFLMVLLYFPETQRRSLEALEATL